jgi:hypothetical protein
MSKRQKSFKPGHGYTRKDWHAVQSPELTDKQMANAKPFAEVFPELAASIRRGRGPNKAPTKNLVPPREADPYAASALSPRRTRS